MGAREKKYISCSKADVPVLLWFLDNLSASACLSAHSTHRLRETKAADRCLGCHVHPDTRWQRAIGMPRNLFILRSAAVNCHVK